MATIGAPGKEKHGFLMQKLPACAQAALLDVTKGGILGYAALLCENC